MILFFSGTGNSEFVADALSQMLCEETVNLNEFIKEKKPLNLTGSEAYVIVFPVYAWRIPKAVEELLKSAKLKGSKDVFFVGTMGQNSGSCDKHCKKLCKQKEMNFKGFTGIVMPSNYILSDIMPDEETAKATIKAAMPKIEKTARLIKNGQTLCKDDKTLFSSLLSSDFFNNAFNKYAVTDKNFVVGSSCVLCGLCKRLCPKNNIEIKDEKIVFLGNCMNCYSCIQHCPKAAINIKGKTENHGRYVCPKFSAEFI